MRRLAPVAATLAVGVLADAGPRLRESGRFPEDGTLRVNQVQVLGTHKQLPRATAVSAEPNEPADYEHPALDEQLAEGIRSLELDVQNGRCSPSPLGDVDEASNRPMLEACLTTVQQWSTANPDHLPLSIFVELKELPTNRCRAAAGDRQLRRRQRDQRVGRVALDRLDGSGPWGAADPITPDQVRGKRSTLRAAIVGPVADAAEDPGAVMVVFNSDVRRVTYLDGHPTLEDRAMLAIVRSDAVP